LSDFIMDARVIGVQKHAVLRTAMPAHDAEGVARKVSISC
jgi:hypothetical protein